MRKSILDMTSEELNEYVKEEANKAGFDFVDLKSDTLPSEYVLAASYIRDNIVNCSYYKQDKYKIAFIEEYIPMGGYVWRIIIFDKNKATEKMEQASNDNNTINLKRVIGSSQVASIYYDDKDVLGVMGVSYFEIYDGDDVERFLGHEYKNLYNCLEDVLSRRINI